VLVGELITFSGWGRTLDKHRLRCFDEEHVQDHWFVFEIGVMTQAGDQIRGDNGQEKEAQDQQSGMKEKLLQQHLRKQDQDQSLTQIQREHDEVSSDAGRAADATYIANEDEEDEEAGLFDGMRSMFEMGFPTSKASASFKCLSGAPINVDFVCSQFSDPGSLQSGKFLWPAARFLAEHICKSVFNPLPQRILELGAGAGLVGLTAAQLFYRQPASQCADNKDASDAMPSRGVVVLTDRDPFLLDMMESDSFPLQPKERLDLKTAEVHWGKKEGIQNAVDVAGGPFDLIIGADLTYSTEVILALMATAGHLLVGRPNAVFLLCSSFRVEETSQIISKECAALGITRTVLRDSITSRKAFPGEPDVIIERFQWCQDALDT